MRELTYSEQEYRRNLKDLFSGIFVVTVLVRVLRFLFFWLIGRLPEGHFYLTTVLQSAAEFLAVFLPFFVMRKYRRDPYRTVFHDPARQTAPFSRILPGLLASAGLTLALTGGMYYLLSAWDQAGLHSVVEQPSFGTGALQTVFYVTLNLLVLPLIHEASFRGVALSALSEENRFCAALVSSFAFAFCDGNLYHIPVRFAVGMLCGWFYLRFYDLRICVALQTVSLGAMFDWFLVSAEDSEGKIRLWMTLTGAVVGLAAVLILFLTRKPSGEEQRLSTVEGMKVLFSSFGIYLILILTLFGLLVNVFFTDPDPNDPLLEPTPEERVHPDFGKQDPLSFDRDAELEDSTDD